MSAVQIALLAGLGASSFGLMVYSYYEAQYIPTCFPDGRDDWRIPIGFMSLLCLATPLSALVGIPFLFAIMVGSIPGTFLKYRKLRDERWAKRPKNLTSAQHKEADKLEFAFDKMLNRMGRKFSTLEPATDVGREEMESAARATAKEYFALTGHDIEKNIDTWLGRREAFKKILERDSITM
jgi:hypothetical protein